MKSGRKHRFNAEINVVPYIDVMLVLLVIFMVTAPLLTTGVKVSLPKAPAKVMDIKKDHPVVLTVTANGDMSLNVGPSPDEPLSTGQIISIVSKVLKQKPDTPVAVRGDKAGSYGDVVKGMVLLQQAGAGQVGLITGNTGPNKASDDEGG